MDELEQVFSKRGWHSHQPKPFRTQFIGLGRLVSLERAAPVFHTLGMMRRAGWIDARYNRIQLLDVAALKAFAWSDE